MSFPRANRPTVTYHSITVSEPIGFRPIHMDLHIPDGAGLFPVVLWVHGGGWQSGSRIEVPESIAPLGLHERLVRHGYAVADVDYRLAREAQYPAQLVDVQAAIRWLRRHAAPLRLDTDRFAALGESAGAHLAAMAGLVGEGDAAIQAVVFWYGPADFTTLRDLDSPTTSPAVLLGGPIRERLDFARSASPVHRVHPGAPPFLCMYGTADQVVPAAEQSEQLAHALRAVRVRCDLHPVPGADHCFVGYHDIDGLIDTSIAFLDDVLK